MAKKYVYQNVNIGDLILDDENPRFASSILVQSNTSKVSQSSIIEHLLKYADIQKLAKRINEVHELHGAELVTCYKQENKLVVLEGNRRICACKLLLDRSLIPEEYKRSFPFIADETKANLESIMVIVYPDRESIQAYLSDRHISGVKKWSALEKNNYYMNLFQSYGTIEEVQKHTSDSISTIRKCIIKYQFFMEVFNTLKTIYSNIEIEKLDYLPMVDRFMDLLVGTDPDVGLSLQIDSVSLKFCVPANKKNLYEEILIKIGEAFLLRKDKNNCGDNELSKIISTEISSIEKQKNLILDDARIPGLINLINKYKNITEEDNNLENDPVNHDDKNTSNENNNDSSNADQTTNEDDQESDSKSNIQEFEKYIPKIKYRPQKSTREFLCFSKDEAKNWNISGDSNYEEKIRSLLSDLATLSVYDHPYACALLYRSLLETCTRFVYYRYSSIIKNKYNENNLKNAMLFLVHNFLFKNVKGQDKDIPKIKETIVANLNGSDIIQILHLYVHFPNPVDEQILLSTWNSMKYYIIACLK